MSDKLKVLEPQYRGKESEYTWAKSTKEALLTEFKKEYPGLMQFNKTLYEVEAEISLEKDKLKKQREYIEHQRKQLEKEASAVHTISAWVFASSDAGVESHSQEDTDKG